MRCFIAIPLPEVVTEEIFRVQQLLPAGMRKTSSFHLTLKFLGEISEEHVQEVIRRCSRVSFASFPLQLSGIGGFPNLRRPNVVWVGFEHSPKLLALQQEIAVLTQHLGKPEDHPFHPHLTLARCSGKAELVNITVETLSFFVDRFALYQSKLTREGALYQEIAGFKAKPALPHKWPLPQK